MNKKANRRAFFVCMFIFLMYVSVTMKLPEKMSFQRVFNDQEIVPANMNMSMQENTRQVIPEILPVLSVHEVKSTHTEPVVANKKTSYSLPGNDHIEPSFFMSLPLVCFAINERLIEKEGLIPAGKNSKDSLSWKKPVDILRDKDEKGLINISKAIGLKHMTSLLKQEGIVLKEGLSAEEILLGRGYVLEKKKLLSLYSKVVSDEYSHLFPFTVKGQDIFMDKGSFELMTISDKTKRQKRAVDDNDGWMMPNLVNLPIKVAVDKLVIHTAKIKIHGNGIVTDQHPKPFERIKGEIDCIIYGKMQKTANQ